LLNYDNLYNDLYSLDTSKGWLGYYNSLKNINNEISTLRTSLNELASEIIKCESDYESTSLEFEATVETLNEQE